MPSAPFQSPTSSSARRARLVIGQHLLTCPYVGSCGNHLIRPDLLTFLFRRAFLVDVVKLYKAIVWRMSPIRNHFLKGLGRDVISFLALSASRWRKINVIIAYKVAAVLFNICRFTATWWLCIVSSLRQKGSYIPGDDVWPLTPINCTANPRE